jgi:hypothetical protein
MGKGQRRLVVAVGVLALAWWLWPQPGEPEPVQPPEPVAAQEVAPTPRPRPRRARQVERDPVPASMEAPAIEPPELRCALPEAAAEVSSGGTLQLHARRRGFPVSVRDGAAVIDFVPPGIEQISGTLKLDGFSPTSLEATRSEQGWSCQVGDLQAAAVLTGRVRTSRGLESGTLSITGCGGHASVDRDGGFFMEVAPEPCVLFAQRLDGVFRVRSLPTPVDPRAGRDVVIDLDLPSWETSGVGVGLETHELGISVTMVMPDSPAELAGIRPGDLIVAVDGEPAASFELDEFVDFAVGPPDTEVVYTLLRDGEEVSLTLVREPIRRRG